MTSVKPLHCSICGLYLTTHFYFYGRRCLEPEHWLAAGLLQADDHEALAQLAVNAILEHKQQPVVQGERYEPVLGG